MGPTLAPSQYIIEIKAVASEFVERCSLQEDSFPLVPELKRFTLRVMLRILFGNDLWGQLETSHQLDMLIEDIHCWSKGLLAPPISFLPWTAAGKAKKARSRIRDTLLQLISQYQQDKVSSVLSTPKSSLLTSLINSKIQTEVDDQRFLSNDAIVDNIVTMLFAGTDTTASILTSAFFILAKDKQLLKRLQGSVDDVRVIEAFLTETQRMYPAAPFTMRVVNAEEGLNVGGYHIPKGWFVTYALAATLTDESIYPNSTRFDMERWLPPPSDDGYADLSSSDSRSAPPIWSFGGGHRMCPGRFLANAESIILLQQVLRKQWDWTLDSEQNLTYEYNPGFFPVDGLRIRLRHEV